MTGRKIDYTYDEIREMLFWELTQNRGSESEARLASEAISDDTIRRWEAAGLSAQIGLQDRAEAFRAATR